MRAAVQLWVVTICSLAFVVFNVRSVRRSVNRRGDSGEFHSSQKSHEQDETGEHPLESIRPNDPGRSASARLALTLDRLDVQAFVALVQLLKLGDQRRGFLGRGALAGILWTIPAVWRALPVRGVGRGQKSRRARTTAAAGAGRTSTTPFGDDGGSQASSCRRAVTRTSSRRRCAGGRDGARTTTSTTSSPPPSPRSRS